LKIVRSLLNNPKIRVSRREDAQVSAAGYRAAFQLSDRQNPTQPLLTIRRITPPPTWDGPTLLRHLGSDF
jgi:hypothetical protein